jgi:hypothetical protein
MWRVQKQKDTLNAPQAAKSEIAWFSIAHRAGWHQMVPLHLSSMAAGLGAETMV